MPPSLSSACPTNISRHTWQRLAINKIRIISPTLNISLHGLFYTNVGCFFHGLFCSLRPPRGPNQSLTSCVTWVRSNVTSTNRKLEPKQRSSRKHVCFAPGNRHWLSLQVTGQADKTAGRDLFRRLVRYLTFSAVFMHPRCCGFSQPNVESYCRDVVLTFFSWVELPQSVDTILHWALGFVPRFIEMAA